MDRRDAETSGSLPIPPGGRRRLDEPAQLHVIDYLREEYRVLLSAGRLRRKASGADSRMITISRTAIVLKPAQPFLDWLHRADPMSKDHDLPSEPTSYLLPECGSEEEARECLDELWAKSSGRNSTVGTVLPQPG